MKQVSQFLTLLLLIAVFSTSCKKDSQTLDNVVTAAIDYKNQLEGISYSITSIGENVAELSALPKTITVPTGSIVRLTVVGQMADYKDGNETIKNVFVTTTINGVSKECDVRNYDPQSNPSFYFPAYSNMSMKVRIVLSDGAERIIEGYQITVNEDSKILTDKQVQNTTGSDDRTILATTSNTGFYYVFAPYWINLPGGIGLYKSPLDNQANKNTFIGATPYFALCGLSNQGLAANEIKLVSSALMQSSNLYPEFSAQFGCGLGEFSMKFEAWNPPVDLADGDFFHNYVSAQGYSYSDLGAIDITNPQDQLVVSAAAPCFKFVTSWGKKGYGAVRFVQNTAGRIEFMMQR